jgi:hypothetical protein
VQASGVLFFIPLFCLLWLSAGISAIAAVCIMLNIMIALYEDIYVFQSTDGYLITRRKTRF